MGDGRAERVGCATRTAAGRRPSSAPLDTGKEADPLATMLRDLRLERADYTRSELCAPWAFAFPERDDAYFHFITKAGAFFRVLGDDRCPSDWCELAAGDAILLPRGSAHILASDPKIAAEPFPRADCQPLCRHLSCLTGETERTHLLFSGTMRFNLGKLHPVLRMMPGVMHAMALLEHETLASALLEAMGCEINMNRVGASSIVTRLADVLAAQVIRAWVEHGCGDAVGWLPAVRDPELGRILAAIHAAPEQEWSVPELARMMGASRSKFACRFTTLVGRPPARYLLELRMDLARQWLHHDGRRIAEVAHRLGYGSEAAFSRAFKRITGTAPSRLRGIAEEAPEHA